MTRLLALFLGLVVLLPASAQRDADEKEFGNPLTPTPHKSLEDIDKRLQKIGAQRCKLAPKAARPMAVNVVGAITRQADGRLGFMPMRQHHMAVEHWFLAKLDTKAVEAKLKDNRCFVRIKGQRALQAYYSPWGRGTIEEHPGGFIGNGLKHGGVYMRGRSAVMGYHERVYQLTVESMVWVRTIDEFRAAVAKARAARSQVEVHIKAGQYADALKAVKAWSTLGDDVGWDHAQWVREKGRFCEAMVLVGTAPAELTDAQMAELAKNICGHSDWDYSLRKPGMKRIKELTSAWPQEHKTRLTVPLIAAWKPMRYRFMKKPVLAIIQDLGGPHAAALDKEVAAARTRLAEQLKARDAAVAKHDYAGVQAAIDASRADYALTLERKWAGANAKQHWQHALDRCKTLDAIEDDAKRYAAIKEAVVHAVLKDSYDDRNRSTPIRLSGELRMHFLPALSDARKKEVEALILETVKKVDPKRTFVPHLQVAELLSAVPGAAGAGWLEARIAAESAGRSVRKRSIATYRRYLAVIKAAMK